MDPHSRRSQFNKRGPKSGPPPSPHYSVTNMPKPNLDTFSSMPPPSSTPAAKKKTSPNSTISTSALLVRRPIATNSRIKRNESYRKDMYLAFVNNALEQKLNGNSEPFDELVNQFNPKHRSDPLSTDTSTSLRTWILALTHVVSRLDRAHSHLVEAVVNMPWTTLDSASVKSYTVFIGMLLSARPEYLSLVLGRIAHGFTFQSSLQTLSQAFPESSASPITRRVIYDRLHYLLQHLLSLIPTLPSTLQPLLGRNFPHKRQNQLAQSTYIRNILRVSSYCPELSEKILATIVDRAIQIDVEIQVELEEIEDDEALEDQPLFEIDPFDMVLGQEPDSSDASDIEDSDEDAGDDFSDLSSDTGDLDDQPRLEIPTNVKHIQDMVRKLDGILTLVFEHFKRTHITASKAPDATFKNASASRPPTPPELPYLPPLPPLPSDSPLPSPIIPSSPRPAHFNKVPQHTSTSEPPPSTISAASSQQALFNTMRTQFNALLAIFDRTILRTFKSRYTQFLIFWYTSLDPEFADIFQGMLVERALFDSSPSISIPLQPSDEDTPVMSSGSGSSTITRAAAASYIGSFVSRAAFVDGECARRVVSVLCEFLRAHLEDVEEGIRTMSSVVLVGGPQHTVFYAVTQAVFLIFCFRWRDLMAIGDEEEVEGDVSLGNIDIASGGVGKNKKWMPELDVLQRVVNSVLNPLRVCSSSVVMQFARVAQATDFIYCYTILESNKRMDYNGSSNSNTGRGGGQQQIATTISSTNLLTLKNESTLMTTELNTFFPFDPYRLPRSAVFIKDVYREWSSVAIDESDDEDSDDDDDGREGEDGNGDDYGLGILSSSPGMDRRRYLAIPQSKTRRRGDGNGSGREDDNSDEGGLGESLEQMSISPRQFRGFGGTTTATSSSVMSVAMDFVR